MRPTSIGTIIEILAVSCWAAFVARPYLNLDPTLLPGGREFSTVIQSNHAWTRLLECGLCALWNGSARGGVPAFADPQSSLLHPLVILTTLTAGVIPGAKILFFSGFLLAGFAQWWLGRVLGLGRLARTWAAGIAVSAGFLAGQANQGLAGMVLSTASAALVFPPLILVMQRATVRPTVLLGVAFGLALLAGQGYMQIAVVFAAPLALLLREGKEVSWTTITRRLLLAALIAALLASPFLVPFLHIVGQIKKDSDPLFKVSQPLGRVLLNLVVDDHDFYAGGALGKFPYPFLYANFIGWIPVALALASLGSVRGGRERAVWFLASAALAILWLASATPLRLLARPEFPRFVSDLAIYLRNCPLFAGLAVAPILGLAAIAVDRIMENPLYEGRRSLARRGLQLVTLVALVAALYQTWTFGRPWIGTVPLPPEVDEAVELLRTPDVQWVNAPIGENMWEERATARGFKLAYGFRTWHWIVEPAVNPVRMLDRREEVPGMIRVQSVLPGINLFVAQPGSEYAAVTHADGSRTICRANGNGGRLTVTCDVPLAGVLTIQERHCAGWYASIDGAPIDLDGGELLAVRVLAGRHEVEFEYLPWDVPVGGALCLLGIGIAIAAWRRSGAEISR